MKTYCDNCDKEVNTEIVQKLETYNVLGEEIELEAQVLICAECGEDLFSEDLDSETINKAYDIYRSRHKLLSPNEIKDIREQYNLSQRSFAKLLNWSDKTIRSYENGSLPDSAHNGVLKLLKNPHVMAEYLRENETSLNPTQLDNLSARVEDLIKLNSSFDAKIYDYYFSTPPSIENGYKSFDYDKVTSVVTFFARRISNLTKTKLLKLMNYSDMIYFKNHGVSIMGIMYVHYPYGPVPTRYQTLLDDLESDKIVKISIVNDGDYEKHLIKPLLELSDGDLTTNELDILNKVADKFENFTATQISEYSHEELGYINTNNNEVISYEYALDMTLQ